MVNAVLLYVGSVIIFLWGVAHIIPTKSIVRGFGPISEDNRKIIAMESIAEGLTLCFLGVLVFLVTISGDIQNEVSGIVIRVSVAMLLAMAVLAAVTGARTSMVPYKVCPAVKTGVAILFILGSVL